MPNPVESLLAVLSRHIGCENALTVEQLRDELQAEGVSINTRQIRKHVEALRTDGHHVCAHPSHGYWIAANEAELTRTCDFLRARALCSLQQLAAMKRVSLPTLVGQLSLKEL